MPENLAALASYCAEGKYQKYSTSGDRVGLITNCGRFMDTDRMLVLLLQSILLNYPGRTVAVDVQSASELFG